MALNIDTIRPLVSKLDRARVDSFPEPATLSKFLRSPSIQNGGVVDIDHAALFLSASLEMWHRAIHSFLLSISWSPVSKEWAVVTSYYSSHYVVRAFAHLHGFYSVNKVGTYDLSRVNSGFQLVRGVRRREHDFYWERVSTIIEDVLFGDNIEQRHRGYASYQDHLDQFAVMEQASIPNAEDIKTKVNGISGLPYRDLDDGNIPDMASLQVLAYKRICYFRNWFDENFGSSWYWKHMRNPSWCSKIMVYGDGENRATIPGSIHR